MIAATRPPKRDGRDVDHLFPRAKMQATTVKADANLQDTIAHLRTSIPKWAPQVSQVAEYLRRPTIHETGRAIFDFCREYFSYKEDEPFTEQVREPARAWADRAKGIDCDCFTAFVGAMLYHLRIPFLMRITMYPGKSDYSHIYAVAIDGTRQIPIDPVITRYDHEVRPIKKALDIMLLENLSGPGGASSLHPMSLAGRRKKNPPPPPPAPKTKGQNTTSGNNASGAAQVAHALNLANPLTALTRNGVLLSMKLNVMNVAEKLRYGYATKEQATKLGLNLARWEKIKEALTKLEKVHYAGGGKPEHLKDAILRGKGNADGKVSGLGSVSPSLMVMTEDTDWRTILGPELANDVIRHEGLGCPRGNAINGIMNGTLGVEPVSTAAALTAATAVMTAIAATVKSIGDIKAGGAPGATADGSATQPSSGKADLMTTASDGGGADMTTARATTTETTTDNTTDPPKKGFIQWVKDNPIPVALGVGVIAIGGWLAYKHFTKPSKKKGESLNGAKKKKKKKATGGKAPAKATPSRQSKYVVTL